MPEAINTYIQVVDYFEKEWTEKEIERFADKVIQKLAALQIHPRIGGPINKQRNVYKTIIHKRVILIYRYKPLKKEIELLSFWNTWQSPRRHKL